MKLSQYEQNNETFVIAEIAQAHDGSVGILYSLLEAAAEAGVDAVKFQIHIAEAESSDKEPFRINFSHVDATRFDYWQRMGLPLEQWCKIKQKCEDLNVEFMATPFSNAAVDLLEKMDVKRYKVGSGDVGNPLLIEKIARTKKEVLLSTGLATFDEIDRAVSIIKNHGCSYGLFQCTTKYPTAAEDIGLPWISKLRSKYHCPVGLSDHSGTTYAGLGAVAVGASAVETHITFDKRMFGPDAPASLTIDELADLVRGIRFLEKARGEVLDKSADDSKHNLRRMFGKSLAVNRSMEKGEVISFDDLEGKKPADAGISIENLDSVVGQKLTCDKQKWDFLQRDELL